MSVFAICISPLVRCLIRFWAHFLNQVVSLLLNFKGSLYMLGTSPLADVAFANIFSQVRGFFSHFLEYVIFLWVYVYKSQWGLHMTDSMKNYKLKNHPVLSTFLARDCRAS